jgi:hypothetical protein
MQPCAVELDELLLTLRPRCGEAAHVAVHGAEPGAALAGNSRHDGIADSPPDSLDDFAAGEF